LGSIVDSSTVELSSGLIRVKDSGITTAKIADSGITTAKINNGAVTTLKTDISFATTAARDAAITSPVAGMTAYINTGDSSEGLYSYTGTTWNKGPSWNAPWGILTSTHVATHVVIASNHTAETVIITSSAATIPANRTIKITAQWTYYNVTAGALATCRIRRGTTTAGTQVGYHNFTSILLSGVEGGSNMVAIDTGASGSTQYVLTTAYSSGNSDYTPTTIIVEDIGPSGAPN
jgi:hypothetical protein